MKLHLLNASGQTLGSEHIDGSRWTIIGPRFVCQEWVHVSPKRKGEAVRLLFSDNENIALVRGKLRVPIKVKPGTLVEFKPGDLDILMMLEQRTRS